MSFIKKITESPVGSVGRTSKNDAINHINDNPELISEFKKIVKKLGGKTIAMELLSSMTMPKPEQKIHSIGESNKKAEDILRENGIKIKLVIGTSFGTEIKLAKQIDDKLKEKIQELLSNFNIKFKDNSVFIVD